MERSPSLAGISHSGRRLIVAAAAVLLGLVGLLSVAFVQWRADYKARVSFGLAQVVIVIDEFGEIRPPDTDAQTWREAIIETHAMLASLVSSNLMNRPQMEAFRNELSATAARARAHPETARAELASVWNAVAQRAPFLLQDGPSGRRKGHRRPALLPPLPQRDKSSAR